MNIFYTSSCPKKCAQYLDDKRVIKMVLETAQILSIALRTSGYKGSQAYKVTHKNHPSCIWTRSSRENYKWLLDHFKALSSEFVRRRGKTHKSMELTEIFEQNLNYIIPGSFTVPPNCAGNDKLGISFKSIKNTTLAYKLYLDKRWENDKLRPKWS